MPTPQGAEPADNSSSSAVLATAAAAAATAAAVGLSRDSDAASLEPQTTTEQVGVPEAAEDSNRITPVMRSVRSEALVGDHPDTAAGGTDDLKRIRGIGVLIERRLNVMGIFSYEQIANWTADDISRVSGQLNSQGALSAKTGLSRPASWRQVGRPSFLGGSTIWTSRCGFSKGCSFGPVGGDWSATTPDQLLENPNERSQECTNHAHIRALMVASYHSGDPVSSIASRFGVSVNTVYKC